jgi:hypothetical protein
MLSIVGILQELVGRLVKILNHDNNVAFPRLFDALLAAMGVTIRRREHKR